MIMKRRQDICMWKIIWIILLTILISQKFNQHYHIYISFIAKI